MNNVPMSDTSTLPESIQRGREVDERFFKRFPHRRTQVRRPFPGEVEAMIDEAIKNGVDQIPYNPKRHYYVAVGKMQFQTGVSGRMCFCRETDDPVPPDGLSEDICDAIFMSNCLSAGIFPV